MVECVGHYFSHAMIQLNIAGVEVSLYDLEREETTYSRLGVLW